MNDRPAESEQAEEFSSATARVGSLLAGKWRLEKLLAVGGMAAVYSAVHKNGRRVAIKVLHEEFSDRKDAKERFLEEAYAVNHVGHPGTVPVLDDDVAPDGCAFLVMELLEGETLDERWSRAGQVLPSLEVLILVEALLEVLGAAHDRGIVHRDIKPDNVFLTNSGEVKLLDFGIARMAASQRTLKTQVGSIMGTPSFMAPEQARGRWGEVDEQSDLWSVAAVAFALLSGRLVHDAETTNETLSAAMTNPAPPLRTLAPHLPADIAAIVDRGLAFEKRHRFDSAAAMGDAVRLVRERIEAELLDGGRSSSPPKAGQTIEVSEVPMSTYRPVTTRTTEDEPSRDERSGDEPSPSIFRPARRGVKAAVVLTLVALGSFAVVYRMNDGGGAFHEPVVPVQSSPASAESANEDRVLSAETSEKKVTGERAEAASEQKLPVEPSQSASDEPAGASVSAQRTAVSEQSSSARSRARRSPAKDAGDDVAGDDVAAVHRGNSGEAPDERPDIDAEQSTSRGARSAGTEDGTEDEQRDAASAEAPAEPFDPLSRRH